jgi:hypothetical protein
MCVEVQVPQWLETRVILFAFSDIEATTVDSYVDFVAQGARQPSPWEHLRNQVFLGSEAFVESMQRKVPRNRNLSEVPQARQRPVAQPLAAYARENPTRDEAILTAYQSGVYTLRDIGDYFDIHCSRVSKILQSAGSAPGKIRKSNGKTHAPPDPVRPAVARSSRPSSPTPGAATR